jgi:hypothetical protein
VVYYFSPNGKYILTFSSLDSLGSDDIERFVDIEVINSESGETLFELPKQTVEVLTEFSSYWIDNEHIFYTGPSVFNVISKKKIDIEIPANREIAGFSKDLSRFIFFEMINSTNSFDLAVKLRNVNSRTRDLEILKTTRYFESSDATPSVKIEGTRENRALFLTYFEKKFTAYTFDFNSLKIDRMEKYELPNMWDQVDFFFLESNVITLNRSKKVATVGGEEMKLDVGEINAATPFGDSILLQHESINLVTLTAGERSCRKFVSSEKLRGKRLIKAHGDLLFFERRIGKNFHDKVVYGTDFIVEISVYNVNGF